MGRTHCSCNYPVLAGRSTLSGPFQLQNGREMISPAPTTEVTDILKWCFVIDFMLPCVRMCYRGMDLWSDEAV